VFPVRYEQSLYISVFRMVRTINSDCFLKQKQAVGLCSGDVMFPVRYGLSLYISVFRMVRKIKSDCFLKQKQAVGLCNGDVMCFL
jgi:hypothetical protein